MLDIKSSEHHVLVICNFGVSTPTASKHALHKRFGCFIAKSGLMQMLGNMLKAGCEMRRPDNHLKGTSLA